MQEQLAAGGDGELPSWSQLALGMLAWSQGQSCSGLSWAPQPGTHGQTSAPRHDHWCLSPCSIQDPYRQQEGSHQLPRKWEANAKASLAPRSLPHASSPAAPPPVSACFHSVSFGRSLIPGQMFTSETAPAACSPRCGRPARPGPFPAPVPALSPFPRMQQWK